MPGRRAKIITPPALNKLLSSVRSHTDPIRSRVIVLLSVRAGLRAVEIAKLDWSMVLNARRQLGPTIEIADQIAKNGSGRTVPMHPQLRSALKRHVLRGPRKGPVVRSARGGAMQPNSIVNWFIAVYRDAGLEGCSSHSGRRTFITESARLAHKAGGSLRDVQILAGHRSIETTQVYIDGDSQAQRRLIALL